MLGGAFLAIFEKKKRNSLRRWSSSSVSGTGRIVGKPICIVQRGSKKRMIARLRVLCSHKVAQESVQLKGTRLQKEITLVICSAGRKHENHISPLKD